MKKINKGGLIDSNISDETVEKLNQLAEEYASQEGIEFIPYKKITTQQKKAIGKVLQRKGNVAQQWAEIATIIGDGIPQIAEDLEFGAYGNNKFSTSMKKIFLDEERQKLKEESKLAQAKVMKRKKQTVQEKGGGFSFFTSKYSIDKEIRKIQTQKIKSG